jgi:FkbM family methyltransferase
LDATPRFLKAVISDFIIDFRYQIAKRNDAFDSFEHRGVELKIEGESITPQIQKKFLVGDYEVGTTDHVDNYIPSEIDVVEIGGGIGFVSCFTNQRIDEGQTHIVLEPNPQIRSLLEDNRTRNNSWFTLLTTAYSPTNEKIEMVVSDEFWSASTHEQRIPAVSWETRGRYEVKATSIEALIEEHNLSEFALVMNAEGIEYEVIEHELDLLANYCPVLITAFHPVAGDPLDESLAKLEEAGFKHIETEGHQKFVFLNRNLIDEDRAQRFLTDS